MADDERTLNAEQIHLRDFSWSFWFTLPLYPFGSRRTIRKEVVQDTVWTFDQLQGIFYVVVPIRMTVVKLDEGGLLVYAPVAPTPECIRLVKELVAEHGDVKYIILPTISGLEHKVFVGPFARCFPLAQVFVAPSQWSFPLNLPLSWLGLPSKRTQVLPQDSSTTPFANQFDYAILGPIYLGPGKFAEVAFFHARSRTLLVTDSVISIPEDPPAIVQLDPYPLLFHAKEQASDIVANTQANRRKGWQRISLFTLYFQPGVLEVPKWGDVFRNALKAPERSKKAYFGLFPFRWKPDWKRSFDALRGDGRLFVAPILQTLILNRAPKETIEWADKVASWDFQRIIPCHFDSPIQAEPHQFRQAFSFLEKRPSQSAGLFSNSTYPLPEEDFHLLKVLDKGLNKLGIVPPAKEKV
ncbi:MULTISPECIES: DUF4336 domain-containing protein [unclassified Coleofasciculus]|uniref:DUF4336 domain-containing protein n=3 Tax=Cyanobacteriota TaxID=1117 RepID=UPI0016889873|nr:DUF4336 domain-containing protein [Coleofasciculus sp. FACHB-SPT9]MBD2538156.1 DUF4336 domain-containing protein [Coleofasciculus sp. FACHB-SPT36]